jgi:hypothetical protein
MFAQNSGDNNKKSDRSSYCYQCKTPVSRESTLDYEEDMKYMACPMQLAALG